MRGWQDTEAEMQKRSEAYKQRKEGEEGEAMGVNMNEAEKG